MPRLTDITGNWFPDPTLLVDITHGGIPNLKSIGKFGHNSAVSNTGDPEDIWEDGGNLVYLTSAETMTIVSTSTEDDTGGTGAENIIIEGLDNDWKEISEKINLNGTGAVVTTKSFIRINRAYCDDVGSDGVNVGLITIDATIAATRQGSIQANDGQTQKTQFSIPAGRTGYVRHFWANCGKGDDATVRLMVRNFGKSWRIQREIKLFESVVDIALQSYIKLPAKSDIRVEAISGVTNGINIASGYDLYISGR